MHSYKVLFLISKKSGLECLKSFAEHDKGQSQIQVVTFDDREDERNCFDAINDYCEDNQFHLTIMRNNRAFLESFAQYNVDAVFVCGWYWIIPNSVLEHFESNVFGIHHSLLPKYRGFSPLVWSMINGDGEVGSSLFKISDGVDVGEVYFQWSCARENKHIGQILSDIESKIYDEFGSVFKDILNGTNSGKEQDHSAATFCARRTPSSGLINWANSAQDIVNFIKAQSLPYPGAYFDLNDSRYIIDDAELFDFPVHSSPGQVVMCLGDSVIVGCGDGCGIEVKKVRGAKTLRDVFYSHDLVLGS